MKAARSSHSIELPSEAASAIPVASPRDRRKGGAHFLAEVLPIWKRQNDPARSTIDIYEAEARRFQQHYPSLTVGKIERHHIRDYVRYLGEELKRAPKTVEKGHGAIRALLEIARDVTVHPNLTQFRG